MKFRFHNKTGVFILSLLFLYCCSPRSYMPGTFGAGTLREYNVSHRSNSEQNATIKTKRN